MKAATKLHPTRNLHLPLSEALHQQILDESARCGRPATVIVREAVEAYLDERRRAAVHDELAAYAERWAGSSIDLDDDLEAAGAQQLRGPRRARR